MRLIGKGVEAMSTATIKKVNKEIDKLVDNFHPGADKKASTVVKAICISTDKKSLKNSKKLVDFLDKIINELLPEKESDIDLELVKSNYDNINENLVKIDSFLSVISKIFDEEDEIEMDEDVMLHFLANLHKAKKQLTLISDYLGLVMQVQKEKQTVKTKTTFGDLINKLKAA